MIVVGEKKYACESCIKGHRSSACKHNDRPLFEVKKKGRPVTQCEHCRELRKTKQVHVKCTCDDRVEGPVMLPPTIVEEAVVVTPAPPSTTSSGIGKKRVKKPLPEATFPAGLPVESLEASAALQALSEGSLDHHHRQGSKSCGCQSGQTCECCVPRPRATKPTPVQTGTGGPSKAPQYRPVLPRPPNARRLSDASHASMSSSGHGHDPSDPAHPHGGFGAHRGNAFFSPYPRPFDYQQHAGSIPSYSITQGQTHEYAPPPPPSATSDGSVDDYGDYRSSPSLGYDFHHQPPPAPPSGYADHQSQVQGAGGYAQGGGRAQPHHEAPFAPPQTPTDVPQPAWPQTLPQHSSHAHTQAQSFSVLGVGIRPDHSAVESLPPSIGRMDVESSSLCGCGPSCACPGCVEHRGPGGNATANANAAAYEMCADPKNCGACLQCSIMSMPASALGGQPAPNFDFGTAAGGEGMSADITMTDLNGAAGGAEYFSGIDEWLRSVGPPGGQYPPSFTYADPGSLDDQQQQQQQQQYQQYQQSSRVGGGYDRGAPSPAMYDYDVTFDPAMFASDPDGMGSLQEMFLPDEQQQREWRTSIEEDGGGRITTFATSGERSASSLASASTSSLSSSYASSLGDPLPSESASQFTPYAYSEPPSIHEMPPPQTHQSQQTPRNDHGHNNPELLVIPPTPALRAGSGLGMSRNDTIDAAAENARYLAAREGSDGDGSSSPGSHYASASASASIAHHYPASTSSRRSTDHSNGRPNISYPYSASVNTGSSSSASKMRSSSIFSGSSGSSRQSASSVPSGSGSGLAQAGQVQQGRAGPDPNRSKTANLPKNFNPFNVFPGAWGSRFSGKF